MEYEDLIDLEAGMCHLESEGPGQLPAESETDLLRVNAWNKPKRL